MKIEIREEDRYCFACGTENPIGLHLSFREEGEEYIADFTAERIYQSYDGVVHGGIVSTLLDEIMGGYLYYKGCRAVTARLEVRYRKPTPVGVPLRIIGRILGRKGRFVDMGAQIHLADGTVTAEGKAKIAILEGSI